MVDDGQWHEHGPAPRRHLVNMEGRPRRQQNHFYWNRGEIFPRELSEQRQIQFAEGVHAGNTTEAQDVGTCLVHEWQIRRIAGELESKICFYRRIDLARSAKVNVPSTVWELAIDNVFGAALLELAIHLAEPVHVQHVIGAQRAIDEQLTAPVAIWFLLTQEISLPA